MTRDRESEVVERVAAAIDAAFHARGSTKDSMARAAIGETLRAMYAWADAVDISGKAKFKFYLSEFERSISLSPQEKEGDE